ncbi:hypothetical protein ACFQE8_02960 [Salinirubellus sp. GCM10025818]|uniref:hypothetical protein n=1 Tax=Salinirubellus TaxID=2162630 RepID=UPI0030D38AF7
MSSQEYEEVLDYVEGSYESLIESHDLSADPIIRYPWGGNSIRLSWTGDNGISKNIISEIKKEQSQLWIEANSWKDVRSGDTVTRRWEHFPDIDPVPLDGPELEFRIHHGVEEAFEQVYPILDDDLTQEKELQLNQSELNLLDR